MSLMKICVALTLSTVPVVRLPCVNSVKRSCPGQRAVFELGAGTGLNAEFYRAEAVSGVVGVDLIERFAEFKIAKAQVPIRVPSGQRRGLARHWTL